MSIIIEPFGKTRAGEEVLTFTLTNASGAYVRILSRGGTLQSICVPDRTGALTDVLLGFDTITEYEEQPGYLGALVGRVANRIGGASFELNGKTYPLAANNGPNCLHGGVVGYSHRIWDHAIAGDALVLTLRSPDGEEGFPGNLDVQVTYTFSDDCRLRIAYRAATDADTIVNLTNHAYFNLAGAGSVLDQTLRIAADAFTPTDATLIPTGERRDVTGTPFDFRRAKPIGQDIAADYEPLILGKGYDHNFCLTAETDAAEAYAPATGIAMTMSTSLPAVQLYTASAMSPMTGKASRLMDRFGGFCLETQGYPDAIHHPEFPSVVLKAGEVWDHYTEFAFSVK